MKKFYHLIFFLHLSILSLAQLHDYTWVLGYGGGPATADNDTFGLSILDFTGEQLFISDNQDGECNFRSNNVSYSDSNGKLILTSDGLNLYNGAFEVLNNGANWFSGSLSGGWRYPQSGLVLPAPSNENWHYLLNLEVGYAQIPSLEIIGEGLFLSIFEIIDNSGYGEILIRKESLLKDTIDVGKLSACRHANGRDWWVIIPEWESNRYHRYLLTPFGVDTVGIQEIGEPVPSGLGQALFSPDGTKHIRYNGISDQEGEYTTIYDFDRCTGELSNFRQFNYPQGGPAGGAAFSKNSRYLYTTSSIYIYQYDLWADDIEASRTLIAEYDGYLNFLPTTFYQAQLGPDGKIYICASNGVRSLHVIHNPDAACPACGVEQHGIALPTYNAFSIPNQPNYRLGPIDGSPCDTLGIDNIPLARWRYSQDTLAPLQVQFTDLSDYEPAAWSWDFGDGAASAEANPLHPFEAPGAYEVCLTASNANGSSTQCKELVFSPPAGSDEPSLNGEAVLFPNPFDAHLSLSLPPGWLPVHASLRLFNQLGQPAGQWRLHAGVNTFEVRHLPGGVYFYVLEEGGKVWQQGKVVRR